MKYYILAGEASGDLHGSNLIKELKRIDANAEIRCWGGELMEEAGGELVLHYKERAFMGFAEVIANISKILGFMTSYTLLVTSALHSISLVSLWAARITRLIKIYSAESYRLTLKTKHLIMHV